MADDPQIVMLLEEAMRGQRNGDLQAAEAACRKALTIEPRNPDAMQFLGLIYRHGGRFEEGEQLMRTSLEINPNQPHTWNNLGSLLDHTGRFDEAEQCFQKAIRLNPAYVDAWANLGKVLADQQRYKEAEAALKQALKIKGDHSRALIALGIVYRQSDRLAEAEECYRKVLAAAPNSFHALYNLAVVLNLVDRSQEALELYQKAGAVKPGQPEVYFGLGKSAHKLGQLEAAIGYFRQAIDLKPDYAEAHETLNKILWQHGKQNEFLASYPPAIHKAPAAVPLRLNFAEGLILSENSLQAEEVMTTALEEVGDDAGVYHVLARAQYNLGKTEQAREAFEAAIQGAPDCTRYRYDYARILIVIEEYALALRHLEAAEKVAPFDQEGWAYKGLCWRFLGDEREAWLNDYERFVKPFKIPVPEGYRDLGEFCEALDRALDPFHDTEVHPLDQTLRGGTQTWDYIFDSPVKEIQEFKKSAEATIAEYLDGLAYEPDHPLLCRLGKGFKIKGSWSVRLKSEGFHVNHVHSEGWLSSSFYVALPDIVASGDDHQGWIKFGESSLGLGEREEIKKIVRPEPGLLVLFPSYTYHGTVPFSSDQYRTTLAFDVVPGD